MSNTPTDQGPTNPATPPGSGPTDFSMKSLAERVSALEMTLAPVRGSRPVLGNPASEDRNPTHLPPKPTAMGIQSFSHLPGEDFVAWRAHFVEMVGLNRWNTSEAKSFAFGQMKGKAVEAVLDISTKVENESLDEFLNRYQKRFLPAARSRILRAHFSHIRQLPDESVQALHSRMRVWYHLAYPDAEHRSEVFLVERFISALSNRDVQDFVRQWKPETFEGALDAATEKTHLALRDIANHAPRGLQQPIPGDARVIATMNAGTSMISQNRPSDRRCFYCDETGHLKKRCPARLRDFLKTRSARPNNRTSPRRPTENPTARKGYNTTQPSNTSRPGGSSSRASRRRVVLSAEAGSIRPYNNDRHGDNRARKQTAAVEVCPAEAVAAEEASFVPLDLASHTPGGLQQPTQSGTSVLASIDPKSSSTQMNQNPDRRCFYCNEVGQLKVECPAGLRDFRRNRRRNRCGKARPRRQVAAIEGECQEEAVAALDTDTDTLDTSDFPAADDPTVAALSEEMASEDPLTNSAEEEDFPEGQ